MFSIGIITASDKGSRGEREDVSGRTIATMLAGIGEVRHYVVVPDEREALSKEMVNMADTLAVDLILTTGGTGLSPRDVTPEATLAVIDRHVPGIPEAMRAKSLEVTSRAMLSRAVAGVRGRTLIINLPGSPKGVKECLEVVLPALEHGLAIMKGEAGECGGPATAGK
ncbi:MAG: MogA/MoaB family molybdenum cofactor biosynthesis protein [Sporomusaceae bacterium]|nr:MogA/MoaB family molybdenum cofactor biosynthesis protein [Sporomusaceae bacterium]